MDKQNRIITEVKNEETETYLVKEERETVPPAERTRKATELVKKAGKILTDRDPAGFIVAFIDLNVKDDALNYASYVTVNLKDVPEKMANMCWNDIKTHIMESFGREIPKVRQDLGASNQ